MARLRITFAFLALCSITFAAEPQPPTLRLPDTVAPTSYRVELTLNTDQSHFNGFIAIKLDIKSSG